MVYVDLFCRQLVKIHAAHGAPVLLYEQKSPGTIAP